MAFIRRPEGGGMKRLRRRTIVAVLIGTAGVLLVLLLSPSASNFRSAYSTDSFYYLRNMEILEARVKSGLPISTIERYQYRVAAWPKSEEEEAKARELCGSGPNYEPWFQQPVELRSEHDEDKLIYETFFKWLGDEVTKRDYIFVELGGYNGLTGSNSRFFDVCLGWQGALVEANPMIFPQLKRNRLNAHRMSFAATCSDDNPNETVEYFKVKWRNAAQVPHVPSIFHNLPKTRRVQVPCGSLTPILSTLFPGKTIQFMNVDVSGAEHLVLENFDFAAVPVEIVLVKWFQQQFCEDDNCDKRKRIGEVMADAGYKNEFSGFLNKYDLFLRHDSPFMSMVR
jgi:hypothetical protein